VLRNLLGAIAACLLVGTAAAQPAPKKVDDKTLVTKVYDLKPLLGERGKANGIANTEAVIKLILDVVEIGELKPGTTGPQVVERENGKLEVRASEKVLEEIKDLLNALERLQDLAVDVKADVIEFDAATFEKLMKAIPKMGKGKPGSPVLFSTGEESDENEPTAEEKKAMAEMTKILKSGKQMQTSIARFVNGAEATFSARQSVVTYKNMPEPGALPILGNPETKLLLVKDGFRLQGLPVVSVDRRFIRLKLTEQSVVVAGIKKRELAEVNGQKIIAQTPELEDVGTTGSTTVADGGTVLFKLAYAPKDKVWVVVLHPTIFIQAEQDVLKKEKEAKK
jgi:hypothetical protein